MKEDGPHQPLLRTKSPRVAAVPEGAALSPPWWVCLGPPMRHVRAPSHVRGTPEDPARKEGAALWASPRASLASRPGALQWGTWSGGPGVPEAQRLRQPPSEDRPSPPASRLLPNLVVHDGAQAHDAHVDVVLLAHDTRVPQGLPAVGRGQPGWGGEQAAGSEPYTRLPTPTPPSEGTSGTLGR